MHSIDERSYGLAGFVLATSLLARLHAKGTLKTQEAESIGDMALLALEGLRPQTDVIVLARTLVETIRAATVAAAPPHDGRSHLPT
jgi:hypothetical protein